MNAYKENDNTSYSKLQLELYSMNFKLGRVCRNISLQISTETYQKIN